MKYGLWDIPLRSPASDEVLAESLSKVRCFSSGEGLGVELLLPSTRFQEKPPSLSTQRSPCGSQGPILFLLLSHRR